MFRCNYHISFLTLTLGLLTPSSLSSPQFLTDPNPNPSPNRIGQNYHISFPEWELLIELQDGDIVTFDAASVMHSLVAPPLESQKSHICLSFYTNARQLEEVRKYLNIMDDENSSDARKDLSDYELRRLENIERNLQELQKLGILEAAKKVKGLVTKGIKLNNTSNNMASESVPKRARHY